MLLAILFSLIAEVALIPSLGLFWAFLGSCLTEATAVEAAGPSISFSIFIASIGAGFVYYINRNKKLKNKKGVGEK